MDPIDDLRQRAIAASARDVDTLPRTAAVIGRVTIQPTSMSRVVWRIPSGDEPARQALERLPRPA